MKSLICTFAVIFTLASKPTALAQAKKKPTEAAAPTTDATATVKTEPAKPAKPADAKAGKAGVARPFYSEADEIDAAGKSFTHQNEDGKKVKNIVTDKTEIKQGDADAKFEDLKVGDVVSGLRVKKAEDGSEYEVIKITKFGPKPAKPEKSGQAKQPEKSAPDPKPKKADK